MYKLICMNFCSDIWPLVTKIKNTGVASNVLFCLSKQQTHCLSPVCFFFCLTGDPQQRVPYAPRPPSARRLGTVPSGLKGAASLCCSQEVDCAPSAKTRSMREIKLNWVTTNSKRTQDNNISGVNIHLTFKCLLEILWWKLFTLISVVSDAVSCHCALNSTTHQTALLPCRSPTGHTLHSSWCCWRGVLWHSSRGSASTMGGMFRWAFLAAGGWFARVKRAQSLRLMGLTLTIQELVQNLHKDNIKH